MQGLRRFLAGVQLEQQAAGHAIEPELKTAANKQRDREIKERQELEAGVVLQATTEPGDEGSGSPSEGDLVYVHYNVLTVSDDQLYSTWAEQGGSGQPLALVLGKGQRAPRAWELALTDMHRNTRKRLNVAPGYGYKHPECGMQPPPGVAPGQQLQFDLQLVNWYPAKQVRVVGDDSDTFKRILVDSPKWEMARAPNEVTFSLVLRRLAYDGQQGTGFVLLDTAKSSSSSSNPDSSSPDSSSSSSAPSGACTVQLGAGRLPEGLESALSHMSKGEKALFVLPADQLRSATANGNGAAHEQQQQWCLPLPALPQQCVQVEACLELHELIQVRDVTGDGSVVKKRLREGEGEFPVDCPLHDTRLSLHFRVRALPAGGPPGPWVYDSRQRQHGSSDSSSATAAAGSSAPPLEVDSGCGELPEGLELVLKLMVPGELASAVCTPHYGYEGRSDAPPGLPSPPGRVEFEAQLVSFEREGYWQHMEWPQRWALAERVKAKGNELFKAKRYKFAGSRYTHLLRLLESTRDFEEAAQVDRVDGLKAACLSNLALVAFHSEAYAECVSWCDKALQLDPENAKVVFFKGKALSLKGDHDEAEQHLLAAGQLDGSYAADVEAARAANAQRAKAAAVKQKQQFRNFFGKKA